MMRRSWAHGWLLLVAFVLVLSACGGSTASPPPRATAPGSLPEATPDRRPRSFELGLSSLPPQLTQDSYTSTFETIGAAADVVLIQRTPPWSELLSGKISDATVETTRREVQLAKDNGLDIFVAIDPTDPAQGRSVLTDLPPDMKGAGFADSRIKNALLTYARFVATNYRPKYLAFGVEINTYQRSQPDDFEQFVLLYHEAYKAIKELSPATLVFPTFQLEDMQGYLPLDAPKPPQWNLLGRFEPRLDLLAVSSYPRSVFSSVDTLPPAYFTQLQSHTKHPIAIVGTGFPSAPDDQGTEAEQATFLLRSLGDAQTIGVSLFVWFVSQDPMFTGQAPFDKLQYLGLKARDGKPKEAWKIWTTVARRPLVEGAAISP